MSDNYGPHLQMGRLAEHMATCYQTDANLELEPHLSHYMDEVEVNIRADKFDHAGFMKKIHDQLEMALQQLPIPGTEIFCAPSWQRFNIASNAIKSLVPVINRVQSRARFVLQTEVLAG